MQRAVDHVLAVAKESVKTFTYESLNHIARLINGFSALLLAFLPGKATILEGIHGWELRPIIRGPRFPRWMENGASSFNKFIYQLACDSDTSSTMDCSSGEEDSDRDSSCAASSHSSEAKGAHGFTMGSKASAPEHDPAAPVHSLRKVQSLKDHIVRRATDRRRGVIEDLHLATEISIEAIFDAVHKGVHFLLSPLEAVQTLLFGRVSPHSSGDSSTVSETTVPTATLGEDDPTPQERKTTVQRSTMNTDARTCEDVIRELGYPYEAIHVVTDDGYILLLERLPRRDARKAVYLQHGILDSSMGWVSNGVVGSPAFAAYDQGYDVFLGNFRGLVSREHVDKNISSREYWKYSINEHGTKDLPAMMEKINQIKTSELKCDVAKDGESDDDQKYNLCAVCHSLGGAAILMYVITRRLEKKPHRLSRLVLLSPAGFHHDSNLVFSVLEFLFLLSAPILEPFIPSFYIPTRFFRMLLNKLARDFHNYPAVGGLVQTLVSYFTGGDTSNWVGVIGLPHYNMNDMPGLSFRVTHHLAQMKRSRKYAMYDYGSAAANMEAYGTPEPVNLGELYNLINIPVDLVGGHKDQVIRPSMVRKHYELMRDAGVEVTYSEYEYAHLDFTFSHSEELLAHVMSRLVLVGPAREPKQSNSLEEQKIEE